jgi:predicted GNAT family N-acyltransferase
MQEYQVTNSLNERQAECLVELYQNEWWTKGRTLEEVHKILSNSLSFAILHSDELVAYARVITDRIYFAFICDVIVHPAYRKKKLGKMIMREILCHPHLAHVPAFQLKCRPELEPFYAKCGFSPLKDGCMLMACERVGVAVRAD